MPLLQRELVDIKNDWNQHKIRLQKKTDRPNGVPDELYDFPEEKGLHYDHSLKNGLSKLVLIVTPTNPHPTLLG